MSTGSGYANKAVLITGAGRGIGAAIARGFAEAGADVVLAARSSDELNTVADQIRSLGRNAYPIPTDLADDNAIGLLAAEAIRLTGGIDVLVSNAGVAPPPMAMLDMPIEQWRQTLQINTAAPLMLIKALAPQMAGRAGVNIIVVSSLGGLGGTPHFGTYGSSKAALNHMIKTLACELGPVGIRINGVLPGPVETTMVTDFFGGNTALFEYYGNVAPLKGWSQAEDMVAPALFLASAGAGRVTGHLLIVDGGLSAINQDAFPPPSA